MVVWADPSKVQKFALTQCSGFALHANTINSAPEARFGDSDFPILRPETCLRGATAPNGATEKGVFSLAIDGGIPVNAAIARTQKVVVISSPEQR
jgi:hypothetical protein